MFLTLVWIREIVQVEAGDSWKQEYTQQAMALLNVVGVFHDVGTVEDEADIHDKMEYTVEIVNTGTVTLTDVGERFSSVHPRGQSYACCMRSEKVHANSALS